jgi:hypothetical protein
VQYLHDVLERFHPISEAFGSRLASTVYACGSDRPLEEEEWHCSVYESKADWKENPYRALKVVYYEHDLAGRGTLMNMQTGWFGSGFGGMQIIH